MYVRVQVRPGARRESVIQTDEKTYTIAVKELAAENRANERVREVLAEYLLLPLAQVRMISGHRSGRKVFSVVG